MGCLYFQSIGDPNDSSLSQKSCDYEESPEELHREVNRLEGKVVALASTLEQQQKEFKEVKDQELDKSTLECMILQERNMDLAKELAALKLASDLNLEEDEFMKLASLGNGVGSKEMY